MVVTKEHSSTSTFRDGFETSRFQVVEVKPEAAQLDLPIFAVNADLSKGAIPVSIVARFVHSPCRNAQDGVGELSVCVLYGLIYLSI